MDDMYQIGSLRQNMIRLARRAAVDREFRSLCLENAAGAYMELTGQPLQEQYTMRFIEPESTEFPSPGSAPLFRLPQYIKKTWLG